MLTLKIIGVMSNMQKFLKTFFILAVCFLVSSAVVFASDDTINSEEKWRLPIGSSNVRYGTKYTIILNEEKYEYYLEYKETITDKFKGHFWGTNNLEKDENYIFNDEDKFTREDVIKFLEIKDEKLVAKIKESYEFSLYIEPYFNYKKEKWGNIYTSTVRELYSMLPEARGNLKAYQNAIDEDGNLINSKIQGIEFIREIIVNTMNRLETENLEIYNQFKNEYKDAINDEMLNKGFIAYNFKDGIKVGEFIKMVSEALWPKYVYKEPKEGDHWAMPYVYTLNHSILYAPNYTNEKLEECIERAEAAEIICKFYLILNEDKVIDKEETYIKLFKDESKIINESTRRYINGCIQFGLMNSYEDGTFRPNEVLTKEEAQSLLEKALN